MQALVEHAGVLGIPQRNTFIAAEVYRSSVLLTQLTQAQSSNPPSGLLDLLDAISEVTRQINVVREDFLFLISPHAFRLQ